MQIGLGLGLTSQRFSNPFATLASLFIPLGSDALITADGNTFTVREP